MRRSVFNKFSSTRSLLALSLLLASAHAAAVTVDAGDYVPPPPGTAVGFIYLAHSESDRLYSNGKRVDGDARFTADTALLRVAKFGEIGGLTYNTQLLLPYAHLSAGGSISSQGSTSGVGDPILASSLWVVNNPQTRTYVGMTGYLWVPVGSYKRDRPLNVGEHRWKADFQLGASKGIGEKFALEASWDVMVAGKNDKLPGDAVRKQSASYDWEVGARFIATSTDEFNLRLRKVTGGENRVNGARQDDEADATSILLGYHRWLNPKTQLVVQGGRDLSVENGFREQSRVQLRLLRIF